MNKETLNYLLKPFLLLLAIGFIVGIIIGIHIYLQ